MRAAVSTFRRPIAALAPAGDDVAADLLRAALRARLVGVPAVVTLGRYVVGRRIGAGGMGVVYEGHDPQLERRVAIKVLHRANLDAAGELQREAQLLARFSHDKTVTVFDIGCEPTTGRVWIAMELVDGVDMRQWLRSETPPRTKVVATMLAAASALAAMHDAGLSHGDFKPDNVLVGTHVVKVADFGLARLVAEPVTTSVEGEPEQRSACTRTVGGGTPGFIAPEQYDGGPASPAADQFAFCAALFECLHGRLPYRNRGDAQCGWAEVPRGRDPLNRLLRRGLMRDPSDRFPSMHALQAALARHAVAPRSRWKARVLASLGIVGAIAGGSLIAAGGAETREHASASATEPIAAPADTSAFDILARTVRANLDTGDNELALRDMPQLLALAESTGQGEPIATARLYQGKALQMSGAYEAAAAAYEKARDVAWEHGLDATATHAVLQLTHLYAGQMADDARALRELEMAEAVMVRRGLDPNEDAEFLRSRGMTLLRSGEHQAALRDFERGLVIAERDHAEPLPLAYALVHVAEAQYVIDATRAVDPAQRALTLLRGVYGDDHATVGNAYALRAKVAEAVRDFVTAREHYAEALRIHGEGPATTPFKAQIRQHLADVARELGEHEVARLHLTAARALLDAVGGDETIAHAVLADAEASLDFAERDLDAAARGYATALRIREALLGAEHVDMVPSLVNLALLEDDRGNVDASRDHARQGLRILGERAHPLRGTLLELTDA